VGGSKGTRLTQFKNVTDPGSAEGSYYTWVDQFDSLGLGRNTFHMETGKGTLPKVMKFQLRPDPLAR
jgi:hypothetical protein